MKKYIITLVLMLLLVFSANAGEHGSSLEFDGINQYVNCGNDVSLNIVDTFTGMFWVYLRGYPPDYDIFLCKGNTVSSADNTYQFILYSDGYARMFIGDGMVNQFIHFGAIPLNTWTHITGSFDGSYLYAWKNGVPRTPVVQTVTPATLNTVTIGGVVTGYSVNGMIDEVQIYNVAKDSAFITWNYRHSSTPYNTDSLKLWLPFNEFTGDSAYDISGYGNHGELQNNPLWNIQSPVIAGKEK